MIPRIQQFFRDKQLRSSLFFILAMLVVFRIAAHIPVPGIDPVGLQDFLVGNQVLGLLNIVTGGGLENFSIVMLGVGPYITASIIFQLLTMIVPRLEELSKEGEYGQRKINQWTRLATVPLAALQGYGTLVFLSRGGTLAGQGAAATGGILGVMTPAQLLTAIVSITAGSVFLMWIGELISERKMGNGISLLIFAGIVVRLPQAIGTAYVTIQDDPSILTDYIIFFAVALLMIAGVVFVSEGQRNIPVSYARRVRGGRTYGGTETHLPLRVNQAGVIPIIFAISILLFPTVVANFFTSARTAWIASFAQNVIDFFQNQFYYGILYFAFVFGFTFFYTSIIFHPDRIAENLQKQGGFIPGIRPGTETTRYLHRLMNRIVFVGALFLGVVAVLPVAIGAFSTINLVIGGTSLLIVVSVVLEILQQIDAHLIMREYK